MEPGFQGVQTFRDRGIFPNRGKRKSFIDSRAAGVARGRLCVPASATSLLQAECPGNSCLIPAGGSARGRKARDGPRSSRPRLVREVATMPPRGDCRCSLQAVLIVLLICFSLFSSIFEENLSYPVQRSLERDGMFDSRRNYTSLSVFSFFFFFPVGCY